MAHKLKLADPDTIWGYVQTLKVKERGSPPRVTDRASFENWLSGH
jgi:hypothetical protein